MDTGNVLVRFCGYCGSGVEHALDPAMQPSAVPCKACGLSTHVDRGMQSPRLLVATGIFAENRILLLRRGMPPYVGQWAPTGGFVEPGESVEAAAIREAQEEVGITLTAEQLIPHGVVSLPKLNQVHILFLAVLEQAVPLSARSPEALEVAWFLEEEFPWKEVWDPHINYDMGRIFERVRRGRLDFYQQSDAWLRVISHDCQLTYLWKADPV